MFILYIFSIDIAIPVVSEILKLPDCKYVAVTLASYIISRIVSAGPDYQKHDLPFSFLDHLWVVSQAPLYGSVGGEVIIKDLQGQAIWKAVIIIFVSLLIRLFGALLSTNIRTRKH